MSIENHQESGLEHASRIVRNTALASTIAFVGLASEFTEEATQLGEAGVVSALIAGGAEIVRRVVRNPGDAGA